MIRHNFKVGDKIYAVNASFSTGTVYESPYQYPHYENLIKIRLDQYNVKRDNWFCIVHYKWIALIIKYHRITVCTRKFRI